MIFGVFSTLEEEAVKKLFSTCAKKSVNLTPRKTSCGRIWTLEVNGSGRGCGIVAADEKIFSWRDQPLY